MTKGTGELLVKIYGGRADVHRDLYDLSNQHRRKHGLDCDLYPSDPLQAPLWTVVTSLTRARRMLEVGSGHGYTAAVMASAAGPDCHVDTIEENPQHVALAERAFQQRGLSRHINVLRGRGQTVLPKLKGHYAVVFLDGDWREYPRYLPHLRRLTRPGSIIVTANLNPTLWGPGRKAARKASNPILPDTARERSALPHIHSSRRMAFNQRARSRHYQCPCLIEE